MNRRSGGTREYVSVQFLLDIASLFIVLFFLKAQQFRPEMINRYCGENRRAKTYKRLIALMIILLRKFEKKTLV